MVDQIAAPHKGAHIGGTIVAMIVAPVVLIVVAAVVGGLLALFNGLMTVIRPEIIGFGAAIFGGIAGCYAARAACDAILKSYSTRAIFIEICLLAALGIGFELLALPFGRARVTPLAQLVTIICASFGPFWKGEDLS